MIYLLAPIFAVCALNGNPKLLKALEQPTNLDTELGVLPQLDGTFNAVVQVRAFKKINNQWYVGVVTHGNLLIDNNNLNLTRLKESACKPLIKE